MDDCCRLVLPYNAVHSIQQTEQIPNDPPQMGAKSTTTSNHPSTPPEDYGQIYEQQIALDKLRQNKIKTELNRAIGSLIIVTIDASP